MLQLNIESVAMNKKELAKELKDIAWQLEHGVDPNQRRVKLNYGHRYVEIKDLTVNPKEVLKSLGVI